MLKIITRLLFIFIVLPFGLPAQVAPAGQKMENHSPDCFPLPVPTINGSPVACLGATDNIYSTEAGMSDYLWTVSPGGTITSGSGTNAVTVTWNTTGAKTVGVNYTNSSGCTALSPTIFNLNVNAGVLVGLTITASVNPVCSGSSVTFTAVHSNGGATPFFQWKLNGINVGTNSSLFTYIPSNGDVITCQLFSSLSCTTGNPVTSDPVVMTVSSNLPVNVSIAASANPICQGTVVIFTATPYNGGMNPAYSWRVNGIVMGPNSPVFTFAPIIGDVITCTMTSGALCTSGNPATSNPVTITGSAYQQVGVSIAASANPACQNSSVTFTATTINGGTSPVYDWKVNGTSAGFNNPSFAYNPANGDVVTCTLTSNAICTTGNPATSNPVAMIINSDFPVSVTIAASQNPVCQGNPVQFTAASVNGGSNPHYQWILNGYNVGTDSPDYIFVPASGDVVCCKLTSNADCASGNPATSNCIAMTVIPVLPVSVSIFSSANPVCIGNTVTITANPYNGGPNPVFQWKVNGANAGTNSISYTYIPVDGDLVTCEMISDAPCASNTTASSNSITMSVGLNLPVSVSIEVSANPVCQGIDAVFTAEPVNGGNSPGYQWKVNGVNSGTDSPVFSYPPVNGDVITCQLTSSAPCTSGNPAMSGAITMEVNPGLSLPVSVTVTPSANPACTGNPVIFTATQVNGGTNPAYQWMVNGLNVGTNNPVYTYNPTSGDFVKCQLTSDYFCATGNPAMSNIVGMTVNPSVTTSITIAASANPSCQGSPVAFTAIAINGGSSPIFQWKVNGVNSGDNNALFIYTPANGDVVTCQLTSSIGCPVNNPVTSNLITMTVNPVLPVTISIVTSTNPACIGSQVTYTATATNGGSNPVYTWFLNGAPFGSNSRILIFIPFDGDVVSCQVTSNALCTSGPKIVLSNQITMSVSASLQPSVSIAASVNPFCQGSPVTLTATPTNGGNTPVYVWKVNCIATGTNSPTFTYNPEDKDFVTCIMTSNLTCASMNPATSNAITMNVNNNTPAGISITASSNPVCQGNSVTYTATAINGGTSPACQWKVNGIDKGTGTVYTYSPANGDVVTCKLTSNLPCVSGSPLISSPIVMIVSPAMPASVSIATSTNPFCSGSTATFIATSVNGGSSPIFQWNVNGINTGANNPVFTYNASSNDNVSCFMTSNATCVSGTNPVQSNHIVLTGSSSLAAAITITSSANPVCQGTSVTLTATPVNGGAYPVYQWFINSNPAGTNSRNFQYTPQQGDIITCQLTSDLSCITGNPAISNAISMTVNPLAPVSVEITVSENPTCAGTSVTFYATPTNGGTVPGYQWIVNCQNIPGATGSSYTYVPVHGDVVVCVLTSNEICKSGSPAISNNINMIVLPIMPVNIIVSASANPFCLGTPVTFIAASENVGFTPLYQWKVNGIIAGPNSSILVYNPADGDSVTCTVNSSQSCVTGNPATSFPVIMDGRNDLPVSVSIIEVSDTVCHGTIVGFTATPVNGGENERFQWKVNGVDKGNNNKYYQYAPENGDTVACVLTSSLTCASGNPAISNRVVMTVNPLQPVSITITPSANPSCQGNTVTFTSTIANGGSTPIYRWKKNGVNIPNSNFPTYSFVPVGGEVISCQLTSNANCRTGNPASSNNVTMVVSPSDPANVTIAASANPSCQGVPVTFTATPFNGGTAPFYQWKVNGVNAGINNPVFTYAPANGNIITCVMTSNSNCITVNTAISNPITMTVSPLQPVSITVTPSTNPACLGAQILFTASGANGGTSPVYQWKVNGTIVGGNSSLYAYVPSNNDVITCKLTSDAACATGNPATSAPVTMSVSQSLPVSISIGASSNPACQGQTIIYTASGVNGGASPVYQWLVNGIRVGSNSTMYNSTPASGDAVVCHLTSSHTCATGSPATSNQLNMSVNPNLPVSVSIISSSNPVCQGSTVTYTAIPGNGGASPTYQWKVNGIVTGMNQPSFSYIPVNGDVVTCNLSSSLSCLTGNPATSNAILMTVLDPVPAGLSIAASMNPACQGTNVTFTATPVNGGPGPLYQWKVNGANAGTGLPYFSYPPVNGDIVSCELTSNASCTSNNMAVSNPITMVVSTDLPVSLSIAASANPGCLGQPVIFTATPGNGGLNPTYQWVVNGINVGMNDPLYSFTPSDGDVVICQVMSDLVCASGNPALSNQEIIETLPNLPVSVAITVSSNPVCLGSPVVFNAVTVNGGVSPSFEWLVNGAVTGTDSSSFVYTPVNGDVVTCRVHSSLECVMGDPAVSDGIMMVVSTEISPSISIMASENPICQAVPVTFTAFPQNGGSSPFYQWQVNGMNTGTNNPFFSYVPVNGDIVVCILTSNLSCASGGPIPSNPVTMNVSTFLPAQVNITTGSGGHSCTGVPVTITATPGNGGVPSYQWFVNGILSGSNQNSYTYVPSGGDQVYTVMTSSLSCATGNPATSNVITLTVDDVVPAGVSISANQPAFCEGTPANFTASPVNGGTPSYQWFVNGTATGGNQPFYSYVPGNNDEVHVIMTSGLACVSGNPAQSNSIVTALTVPLPASVSITADQNNTCSGTPVSYTASAQNGGTPSYQWYVNGVASGTGQEQFVYNPQNGDEVSVVMTSSLPCVSGNPATSNSILMQVRPSNPVNVTISPDQNDICEGTQVTFTAQPVNGGNAVYQWYVNSVMAGLDQPTFLYTPSNGDVVSVVLTSDTVCAAGNPATSNLVIMDINAPLSVTVSASADQNNVCEGTTVTYTATPVNGGAPAYQWYLNSNPVGLNQPTYSTIPVAGDQVYVVMTSDLSCISGSPATSNTVSVTVNAMQPVSVSIAADQANVCEGTIVTFTATPVNGGSAAYQWYLNSSPVGLDQPTYSYIPVNDDQVYVVMTSGLSCVSGSPTTSGIITITVNPVVPASISITADQNNVCEGTAVTLTATPSNGGTPSYQWYLNSNPVGLDQSTYSYIPVNGDQVYVVMTSSLSCISANPATSAIVTLNVNAMLPVSVSVSADQDNVCEGTTVTYTATPVNGGNPTYQWYLNSNPVGLNQPVYTTIPVAGDQVYLVMTSDLSCISGSPATSNTVSVTVNAMQPVSVSIAADQANVCEGTIVTFTATPVNGGSAAYQWYLNSSPVGLDQPTYSYIPVNDDQVYVVMTSGLSCISGSPATSGIITITVNPVVPASVSITADQNNVCEGTTVTLTATPVNGGTPSYQWYLNSNPMGLDQPSYSYIPVNGDQVYVVMTSSLSCISGNPATSAVLTLNVNAMLPVSISVAADQNTVCEGTAVTYTAISVNGGNPTYQWYLNSNPVGLNQPTYSTIPVAGDQVYVVMTSDLSCISGSPATSNTVSVTVNAMQPVSVSIAADQANVCEGTAVTFTATPVNGGSAAYQWYLNSSPVGLDQPTYSYIPVNGDQVYVVMTSGLACVSGNPATSEIITITVNPIVPVSVSITADQNNVCEGTTVTLAATPVNGGTPSYQWYLNSNPMGLDQPTYSYIPVNGDQVYVVMTSSLSCISGNPATSAVLTINVNAMLPVSVSVAADQNTVCEGTAVTYTATSVNGGNPTCQWYLNSNPVGLNQLTYTTIPVAGDQVYVVMTSDLTCISGSPATSNTVSVTVNAMQPVSVSIAADQANVCEGTAVTFTATPVNGGSAAYQWYLNSSPVGLDQPTYSFIPVNGDQVYVVMTSGLSCVSGSPATSGIITITVNPVVPASVSITADQNNVCQGSTVTFTATPVNGGSPTYQWYKNSSPVGLNQSTYSCIPANGDQIYSVMTSNLPCATGSPATSNTLTMTVNQLQPVSVSITESQNNTCNGVPVTFTAFPVNGGNPSFQWYQNSVPVGSNQATYNCVPVNADQVYVVMTSDLNCTSGNPATSNTVTLTVVSSPDPAGQVSGPDSVCAGSSGVIFSVAPIAGATTYNWTFPAGAVITSGNGSPVVTVDFAAGAVSGSIQVFGSNGCGNGNTSPDFTLVVSPVPQAPVITADIQLLQSDTPLGNQWYFEGNPIPGANGQTYFATNSGWYWTAVTLNGCESDTSNHIYILCVGIGEGPDEISCRIYPVPNNGVFRIFLSIPGEDKLNITIYNAIASKIYEDRDIPVRQSYEKLINLGVIADGIYTVVITGTEKMIVRRIIVNSN